MTADLPQIGFGLPVAGPWATPGIVARVASRAEVLGYASLWTFQRVLFPIDGGLGAAHRMMQDPVVTLAYAAGITSRIRLGTATVCAPFTPPAVLAKSLTSLDVISGGRLTVGLGMGWLRQEYTAAGLPFERRGARFEEYLGCLKALWAENPVHFAGEFYTIPPSEVNPKPVQQPYPPILLGGAATKALQRAGRVAQGWIASSDHDLSRIDESIHKVQDAALNTGRDPDDLQIVVRAVPDLLDREPGPERRLFQGTRQQVLADLISLHKRGVTEVFLDLNLSPRVGLPDCDPMAALEQAEHLLEAFAPTGLANG